MTLRTTKNILVLCIIFLFVSGCDDRVSYVWNENSLDEIINKNDDKIILVDFETDWCVWCDRLDKDTYTDQGVMEFAEQNLISIKIDAEKNDGPEQKKKYRVRGYPTILLLDPSGNELDRIVGYRPPKEFLEELIRIKGGENTLTDLLAQHRRKLEDYPTQLSLSKKYISLNLPDSARKHLDNVYTYQQNKSQLDFSISLKLSQMYYQIGPLDRSIDLLEEIIGSGIDSSDTAYFYRLLYKARKNSDIDELYEYVNLSENVERKKQSYWQMIRILKKQKKNPELEADFYLKVIALYDSDYKYLASLLNSFAWRMTELEKNLDLALEKIDLALEFGEDIRILDTKAEVLWKLGLTEEALKVIKKCIERDPNKKYYKDQKNKFLGLTT
jgi:thioredoxin-related protein